jgi:hypothetical protein
MSKHASTKFALMAMLKNVLAKLKAVHYDCQERSVYNLTNLSIRKLHTYMNSNDAAKLCAFTATYFTWQTCAWAAFGLLRKVCSLPYESLRGCFFPRISMSCGIWTTLVLNGSGYAILNWCLKKIWRSCRVIGSIRHDFGRSFRRSFGRSFGILRDILWDMGHRPQFLSHMWRQALKPSFGLGKAAVPITSTWQAQNGEAQRQHCQQSLTSCFFLNKLCEDLW